MQIPDGKELAEWNIYSPLQARRSVQVKGQNSGGSKSLVNAKMLIRFDYSRARACDSRDKKTHCGIFNLTPGQNNTWTA
jgi:hypothetical protein